MSRECLASDQAAGTCLLLDPGDVVVTQTYLDGLTSGHGSPDSWTPNVSQAELDQLLAASVGICAIAFVMRQIVRTIRR